MKISINCCHRSDCEDTHCPGRPYSGCARQEQTEINKSMSAVTVVLLCSIGGLSSGWLLAMAFDAAGLR